MSQCNTVLMSAERVKRLFICNPVIGVEYILVFSETSLIRHSMGPENNVRLGGCWIMEYLSPYLCMVTVPHIMVGLERMLDYRDVGLARFHCMYVWYLRSSYSFPTSVRPLMV